MSHWGQCKYCGSDIVVEVYKKGRHGGTRLIAFCDNEKCEVKPCTDDDIPTKVMEELKYFAE